MPAPTLLRRLAAAALVAAVLLLAPAACGAKPAGSAIQPSAAARTGLDRVAVVVMENTDYRSVIGSPNAPYLNRLAHRYAHATGLRAETHPSLPNYLALLGGSTFGIHSDCTRCAVNGQSLVDQLEAAGISWRAYMEDMPRPCYRGAAAGDYVKHHNPFMYFTAVASDPARCAHAVPAGRLTSDLARGALPRFTWLSPNLCHDMHDCGVRAGDRYLSHLLPRLLRALGPRGAVFLTWDEADSESSGGGRIPTIVAGPAARPGAVLTRRLDHYAILRTIEESLGLRPLRHAARAGTLAPLLR